MRADIAADMARPGFASRRILVHIAFSVSKLTNYSSFETEKEFAPPLSVRDAFPKVLIARTRHEPYTREGVLVLDLARWLLGEQGF